MMPQSDGRSSLRGGFQANRFPERKPCNSGIVVLALNRQVLYVDTAGRELLQRLGRKEKGGGSESLLPKTLVALVDEIVALQQTPVEDRSWRRLTATRLIMAPGQFLFVQAFAQPRELPHRPRPVIVLTMQSGESPAHSSE
jgi:hypothetical protein